MLGVPDFSHGAKDFVTASNGNYSFWTNKHCSSFYLKYVHCTCEYMIVQGPFLISNLSCYFWRYFRNSEGPGKFIMTNVHVDGLLSRIHTQTKSGLGS